MLGPSKSILNGRDFVIAIYTNSSGLSDVFRYNSIFVIAGFIKEGFTVPGKMSYSFSHPPL